MQLFPPVTYCPEPEVVPAGQLMQTGGNRLVDDRPEPVNISVELVTEQTFQPVTSLLKAAA